MWDEQKHLPIHQLRQRQSGGGLSEAERGELALLVLELEATEANYLIPATERLRQERKTLESQNRSLEVLRRRKEALALRLRHFLPESQAERQATETAFAAVRAGS